MLKEPEQLEFWPVEEIVRASYEARVKAGLPLVVRSPSGG